MLVLSNGELVTVEWVQHELLESPIKVYNFEVEDFHTYFVGECGVLVHNDCVKPNQDVYVLYDPKTNQVEYVGRSKDAMRRKTQHSNSANRGDLEFALVAENVPYAVGRGMEQRGIEKFNTLNPVKNNGSARNNQIRGIRLDHDNIDEYLNAADDYMYLFDKVINEKGLKIRGG